MTLLRVIAIRLDDWVACLETVAVILLMALLT
jgi:hypothetical protein